MRGRIMAAPCSRRRSIPLSYGLQPTAYSLSLLSTTMSILIHLAEFNDEDSRRADDCAFGGHGRSWLAGRHRSERAIQHTFGSGERRGARWPGQLLYDAAAGRRL